MSTGIDTRPAEQTSRKRHDSWLSVAVVALVAALVGLGVGYLLFDTDAGDEVPAEVETLLAD